MAIAAEPAFQVGGTSQVAPFRTLGGFDVGGGSPMSDPSGGGGSWATPSFGNDASNLASGASPYPIGTPPSPSSGGGYHYSQNGPTLPAPDLGKPDTQMYGRLQSVLGNPSQIAQDPAYKFLFDQGMQAFNRTQAGRKMTLSGNAALGAQNYGQGLAANYFNQIMPQLLSGSKQELERYQVPGQLAVQRYGASHGGTSFGNQFQTGANQGTQGDYGARDLLNRMAQGGGGSYGGGGAGTPGGTRLPPYPQGGGGQRGGGGGGGGYGQDNGFDQTYDDEGFGDQDWMDSLNAGGDDFGFGGGGGSGGASGSWEDGTYDQYSGGGAGGGGGGGWGIQDNNDLGMWSGLDYPIYDYSGGGDGG